MRQATWLVLSAAGVMPAVGCAEKHAPAVVSGTVTFDGNRIEDGSVYFVEPGAEAVGGFSRMQAGRYRAAVRSGRWLFRITANCRVSDQRDETGNPLPEQYIPSRFNDATKLEATIERSQRLDWTLPRLSSFGSTSAFASCPSRGTS
jgi:hypothetical protein